MDPGDRRRAGIGGRVQPAPTTRRGPRTERPRGRRGAGVISLVEATAPGGIEGTGRELLEAIRSGALPPPPAAQLLRLDLEVVGDGETVFGFDADPAFGTRAPSTAGSWPPSSTSP